MTGNLDVYVIRENGVDRIDPQHVIITLQGLFFSKLVEFKDGDVFILECSNYLR